MSIPVVIEKPCFFTMATSCIEVFNKETTGFLFGQFRYRKLQRANTRAMVLEAAYPLQTARRMPSQVEMANKRAFARVEAAIDSMGYEIIGEYHSHPNWRPKLSKSDIAYAKEQESELVREGYRKERRKWLELVISIHRKEYEREHKVGWSFHDYVKKAGAVFRLNRDTGYRLTIAAYWLTMRDGKPVPVETQVFIPWWKGYWSR